MLRITNLGEHMDNSKILSAIDEQIGRLQQARQLLGGGSSGTLKGRRRGKGTMSAAARRKISLAQKARWAKKKVSGPSGKPKRTISAASRRRMAAAQKARWAKAKT
jgi:hypothetical protein